MNKKIISIVMMAAMSLALMPITRINAENVDGATNSAYQLKENKTDQLVITSGTVTLDLNGHTISTTDQSAIVVEKNASLTITDSSASVGSVKSTGSTGNYSINGTIFVMEGGTLHIEKGNYIAADCNVIENHGEVVIDDGSFSQTASYSGYSMFLFGGDYYTDNQISKTQINLEKTTVSKTTINGGTFTGYFNPTGDYRQDLESPMFENKDYSTLSINGGTFKNYFLGIYNIPDANVYISNGDFQKQDSNITADTTYGKGGSIFNAGYLEVSGGTFATASNSDGLKLSFKSRYSTSATGKALIYGGSFTGPVIDDANDSTVYAGTFTDTTDSVIPFVSKNSTYTTTEGVTTVTATTVMNVKQNVYFDSTPNDLTFTYSIGHVAGKEDNELIQDASTTGSDQVFNGITPDKVSLVNVTNNQVTFGTSDYNVAAATTDDQKTAYQNKEKVAQSHL